VRALRRQGHLGDKRGLGGRAWSCRSPRLRRSAVLASTHRLASITSPGLPANRGAADSRLVLACCALGWYSEWERSSWHTAGAITGCSGGSGWSSCFTGGLDLGPPRHSVPTTSSLGARQFRPCTRSRDEARGWDRLPVRGPYGQFGGLRRLRGIAMASAHWCSPPATPDEATCPASALTRPVISRDDGDSVSRGQRPATVRPIRLMHGTVFHVAAPAIPCWSTGTLAAAFGVCWPCSAAPRFAQSGSGANLTGRHCYHSATAGEPGLSWSAARTRWRRSRWPLSVILACAEQADLARFRGRVALPGGNGCCCTPWRPPRPRPPPGLVVRLL